jgi:hypothetical protein
MNNLTLLTIFSGVLMMSYILGAIFSLIFESPFIALQSILNNYLKINKTQSNNIFNQKSNINEMKDLIETKQ